MTNELTENREHIQTTIRIPYNVWVGLRRLQEQREIKSINHEAVKHFTEITKNIKERDMERQKFNSYEIGIPEDDCGDEGSDYYGWMEKNHPEMKIEFFPNQSGGSYLLDADGNVPDDYSVNYFWEEYCND